MSNLAVVEHQGVLVVDSRLIAEELGLNHSTWMTNVIKKYEALLETNFGHLHFENGTVTNSVGAVNKVIFAWLMEDQATFLMTLSRNTSKVINAKIKLVKAFSEAKAKLATKQVAIASIEQQPPLPASTEQLPTPTLEEISNLLDLTLGKAGLDKNLVAGAKLNAIAKRFPYLLPEAEEAKTLLVVPIEDRLLTPTQVGEMLQSSTGEKWSARRVNKVLIEKGFQESNEGGDPDYLPTETGKQYGSVTYGTAKKHGKTVQHLRWYPSVVEVLEL